MTQFSISYSFAVQPDLTTYSNVVYGTFYLSKAINDFGKIAGTVASGHGRNNGFTYDTTTGTLDTNAVPPLTEPGGATRNSSVGGINDLGQLAGSSFNPITIAPGTVGLLITNGNVATFTFPGSYSTQAFGLNNLGQVAGIYRNDSGTPYSSGTHGFAGTPGNLHAVDVPNAVYTQAEAINDWGQVVGFYADTNNTSHGFVETPNGRFSTIDAPNVRSTTVTGINDWGQIVGSYTDTGGTSHGFVETFGRFQTLDVPGADSTQAFGINNRGEIVGTDLAPTNRPIPTQYLQIWVAKPSFLAADQSSDAVLPLAASAQAWLPDHRELSSLVQALSSGNWSDLAPMVASETNPIAADPTPPGSTPDITQGGAPSIWFDVQNHWPAGP